MGDPERGIYEKFIVNRTDGKSEPGGKHEGCRYFVLDLDHDPFSVPAIAAYAEACSDDYPLLSLDLRSLIDMHDDDCNVCLPRSGVHPDDPEPECNCSIRR